MNVHRISVGALVLREGKLLLVRHLWQGRYDFWAPPGGGVEGEEELSQAAERETFEETGIQVRALQMAYIDELIDGSGRMVKFWYLAEYLSGEIDVQANPATDERILEAGWFHQAGLPLGLVFPEIVRSKFWSDAREGFAMPIKLPLMRSVF